jgi:hypothetical protein
MVGELTIFHLLPQSTNDKFCGGFERRLEFCLASGGQSSLNQLWYLSERHAIKNIFKV